MINTGSATPRLDLLGPILQEGFDLDTYVAARILPTILVQKKAGAIPSFLFTNNQSLAIKHAPKTAYARVQSTLSQGQFSCTEAGVEEFLSPEDYEIMGKDYAETAITRRLIHTVLRARDVALSTATFSAGGETTFATNLVTAGIPWSTFATAVPLTNILDAKRNIMRSTGLQANTMLIGYDALMNLYKCAQVQNAIRAQFGYAGDTKTATMTEVSLKVLASVFALDEIVVGGGIVNANQEGVAANNGFIWPSNYALVFRRSLDPGSLREVGLGRTFVYDLALSLIGSLAIGSNDTLRALTVESYRKEDISSDAFRAREYVDMQYLYPQAGALIKSI